MPTLASLMMNKRKTVTPIMAHALPVVPVASGKRSNHEIEVSDDDTAVITSASSSRVTASGVVQPSALVAPKRGKVESTEVTVFRGASPSVNQG